MEGEIFMTHFVRKCVYLQRLVEMRSNASLGNRSTGVPQGPHLPGASEFSRPAYK